MLESILARVICGGLVIEPALSRRTVQHEPPPPPYVKASTLGRFPELISGIGTLYVSPNNLSYGPFLAYDRHGRLVSTIYKIALKDIDGHVAIPDLPAPGGRVTHVSFFFHEAHPGVEERHYHLILWHTGRAPEERHGT